MSSNTILHHWLRAMTPGFVAHPAPVADKDRQSLLALACAQWCEKQRLHAAMRDLNALGNATRRDLGLPERLNAQMPWADHDRGRW
jgi:hypothetical protein